MAERISRRDFFRAGAVTAAAVAVGSFGDNRRQGARDSALDCDLIRRVMGGRRDSASLGLSLQCFQEEPNQLPEIFSISIGRLSIINNDRIDNRMSVDVASLDYWIKRNKLAEVPVDVSVVLESNNSQKTALLAVDGSSFLMAISATEIMAQYPDLVKREFGVSLPDTKQVRGGFLNLEINRFLIQALKIVPRLYRATQLRGGIRSSDEESRLMREANVEVSGLTAELLTGRLPKIVTVSPRLNDGRALTA